MHNSLARKNLSIFEDILTHYQFSNDKYEKVSEKCYSLMACGLKLLMDV